MLSESEINRYYATRLSYQDVYLTPAVGTSFGLGDGLDMSDPARPVGRPERAFGPLSQPQTILLRGLGKDEDIENAELIDGTNTVFREDISVAEESKVLYANFSASYGFSNARAAYEEAYSRKETHKSVYVLYENLRTGPVLDGQSLKWISAPASETVTVEDARERLTQFVADYGSHYIASVNYGFRIALRATLDDTNIANRKAFSLAVKAEFGSFGGSGEAGGSHKTALRNTSVQVAGVVTSGGLTPTHASVMFGYDQVIGFLLALKEGRISIRRAPVSANANSYWHTLTEYPKSREALRVYDGQLTEAPYGVPRGAILPWVPNRNDIIEAEGRKRWRVPEGWALCDGIDGRPDLNGRFLMGAPNPDVEHGGSAEHTHPISISGAFYSGQGDGYQFMTSASMGVSGFEFHRHGATAQSSSNLPPYVTTLFIIKL